MKTGTIVYISGKEPEHFNPDPRVLAENLGLNSDQTLIVSEKSGCYDLHEAWFSLAVKGMHKIVCYFACFNTRQEIYLTERSLRFCG